MPIDSPLAKENAAAGYITAATHASLHTADPAGTGANEVTGGSPAYARVPITWAGGGVDGIYTATLASDFNVPAGTDVAFMGLWTALTGGSYLDKAVCEATFASQGTLQIADITYTQT